MRDTNGITQTLINMADALDSLARKLSWDILALDPRELRDAFSYASFHGRFALPFLHIYRACMLNLHRTVMQIDYILEANHVYLLFEKYN